MKAIYYKTFALFRFLLQYFSEPEFDTEYSDQHVHKNKVSLFSCFMHNIKYHDFVVLMLKFGEKKKNKSIN